MRECSYSQSDFIVWSICNSLERHHNLPLHHHFHKRGFQVFIHFPRTWTFVLRMGRAANRIAIFLDFWLLFFSHSRLQKMLQLNTFTWIVRQWRDWAQELLHWDCKCHYLVLGYLLSNHSCLNVDRNKREVTSSDQQQQELLTFTQKLSNNVTRCVLYMMIRMRLHFEWPKLVDSSNLPLY